MARAMLRTRKEKATDQPGKAVSDQQPLRTSTRSTATGRTTKARVGQRGTSAANRQEVIDVAVAAVKNAAVSLALNPTQVLSQVAEELGINPDLSVREAPDDAGVMARQLGPYLSSGAVQRRAGIGRSGLYKRRTGWAIIAVPTDDHDEPLIYPVRQFADKSIATVLPGIQEVAKVVARGINDPLTVAAWLDSPHPDLDGKTAYEWLRSGRRVESVIEAAERDVTRWQH